MRYLFAIVCMIFFCLTLRGQDQYHQELLDFLAKDFQIQSKAFLLFDTEQEINQNLSIYGNQDSRINAVQNFTFAQEVDVSVKAAGDNVWDSGINIRNRSVVQKNDIILITFWAKQSSTSTELKIFAENSNTFEKEIYFTINLTPDWTQYFAAYQSSVGYPTNELTLGFHMAAQVQQFQIAGFTALNFGPIELNRVPSTFSPAFYGGHESDASWRAEADQRIENLRKKDLVVQVVNGEGEVVPGAGVQIEMQRHEFGFGSALVGCRFPGNRCYDATYVEKILDLDGKGHGFNVAVTENALKWDAWEENWIGTPDETVSAVQWLYDHDIKTRGHTLIWPGWTHMPDDMMQNQNDIAYLTNRIHARIEEMVTHPVLSTVITEWDVLNEITQVRDLEKAIAGKPNYPTGREIYPEILSKVAALQPDMINYVNDYVVLSGGGSGNSVVNRYKTYLDEILSSGAKFDGIGFQAHIGTQPTSIIKVKEVLDEFLERYGKRMKITEYDINDNVDAQTQADYLADFLTMVFSHPGVDAFLMWGFWDGNHWKNSAPIFNQDWSIKPSGQVFIDKVFNEWWTDELGETDDQGHFTARVFKGEHHVSIKIGGEVAFDTVVKTSELDTLVLKMATTADFYHSEQGAYTLFPNPTSNQRIYVRASGVREPVDLQIYSQEGRRIQTLRSQMTDTEISLSLATGAYYVRVMGAKNKQLLKLIVP